jgi:hypothetical protein
MSIKVHIADDCSYCQGKAYLQYKEAESCSGDSYTQYKPCSSCHGTGRQGSWITIAELARLIDQIDLFEPDYATLGEEEPIGQYLDSRESAGL